MSKKKIITIVSVLAVILLSASVISYSIATRGNGESNQVDTELTRRGAEASATYTTNIDLIIQNSNKTPNEYYNIVEIIPSSASPSSLQAYIENGGFKQYVIDANSENGGTMAAGTIRYDVIRVSGTTSLDDKMTSTIMGAEATLREILDETDLIYMSSPEYGSYEGNMSEDIYNYLHTYALGKNKPIILDYVTASGSGGGGGAQGKKYVDLVNAISNNYIRFNTYAWSKDLQANDFFASKTGSYYRPFNTTKMTATGKVLVISASESGTDTMYAKMQADQAAAIKNAYFGTGTTPKEWTFDFRTATSVTATDLTGDYDFILLENDIMNADVSDEIYTALKTWSESGKFILHDNRTNSGNGGSTGDSTPVSASNNYLKLMEMLVTNKGIARYSHVLAISYGFFDSLNNAGNSGLEGAKTVADVINAGDYRGSNTNGSKGKVFRVLELQPCYPVDLDLAEKRPKGNGKQYDYGVKGNYYTSPSQLTAGVTKDEVEEGTEYYAFDLSRAKIAKATGLAYNQIQVDQMSTNEFISKKDVVIETYDLVYIGGDTSALVPHDSEVLLGNGLADKDTEQALKLLTSFDMFTHTGQLSKLGIDAPQTDAMKEIAGEKGQNFDSAAGQIFMNGAKQDTITEYNGNDINNIKYAELKEYAQKGMPIIVDKRVADAFEESKQHENNRLEQLALNQIDPDCWMYKALNAIYALKDNASVEWGLDTAGEGSEIIDSAGNADHSFGNTIGSSLTVFNEEINGKILTVMNSGNVRPVLAVTSSPKEYSEGNPNSYNEVKDGFTVQAYAKPAVGDTSGSYEISLYIDLDGNGIFSEGNIANDGECAQTVSYTYTPNEADPTAVPTGIALQYGLDEDFYGIISWKVVAKDVNSGLVSSFTGYSYYQREETAPKKQIEVLQIIPRRKAFKDKMEAAIANNTMLQSPEANESGGVTLYLCKDCQLVRYRAEYNPWVNGDGDNAEAVGHVSSATQNEIADVHMGLHDHTFGIVRFDSATQDEDWESNLADVLTGEDGDYNADIDIMYSDEFEELVATIQNQSAEDIENNKIQMAAAYSALEEAESDPDYELAEEKVKEQLIALKDASGNLKRRAYYEQWAEDGEYYKFWLYNSIGNNMGGLFSNPQIVAFRDAYNDYIQYRDRVTQAKRDYRTYRRLSYTPDKWLTNNYSIVVLGWAEDFGGEDLNDDACAMLTDYINRGGSMLNTHDSTTKYAQAGAINITDKLRTAFGMDRFHVTSVEGSSDSGVAAATLHVPSVGYKESTKDVTYRIAYTADNFSFNDAYNTSWRYTLEENKPKQIDFNYKFAQGNGNMQKELKETSLDSGGDTVINFAGTKFSDYIDGAEVTGNWTATVSVYRGVPGINSWDPLTWELVTTQELPNGTGTVTVPKAMQMTKELSDDYTITLRNTDRNFRLSLVDAEAPTLSSVVAGANGDVHETESDNLTVKMQVQLPSGYNAGALKDIPLTLDWNGQTYSAKTDASGLATFSVPQGSPSTVTASSDIYNISSDSLRYRHFVTDDVSDEEGNPLYFFTERAVSENCSQWNKYMLQAQAPSDLKDVDLRNVWGNIQTNWRNWGYNSPVGVTDSYIMYNVGMYGNPYRYVEYTTVGSISWDIGYGANTTPEGVYGPNGASQVNKGIVTTYPFYISSELRIAQTHSQTYALDLEDKDVAVWYTLAPGTGRNDTNPKSKGAVSYFAASPHDGMNNYYLYSKGNIFYCGSGHSLVTGPRTDNNDERRLFINIIVNSVRNAAGNPVITVHRKGTDGAEVKEDKNEKLNVDGSGKYYYNVDDSEETPEFDFKVRVDSKADLAEVYVFYDLDYQITDNTNSYKPDANHVLIAQYNTLADDSKTLVSKELAKLRAYKDDDEDNENGYKNLKLKQEYFDPYGGHYTYIVIQATDTNGKTSYQRIKINLIPKLWDLTMTEPISSRILVDMSDRVKYNI